MCGSAPTGGGGATPTPPAESVQAVASKQVKKVNEFAHNNAAALASSSAGGTVATSTTGLDGTAEAQDKSLTLGG